MSQRSPTSVCLLLMLCCVIALCYSPVLQELNDFTASQVKTLATGLLALCTPVVARHWCLVYILRIVRVVHRAGVRRVVLVVICVQGLGIIPYAVYLSVVHLGQQYIDRLDHSVESNWELNRQSRYSSNDHHDFVLHEHITPPGSSGVERNRHPVLYDPLGLIQVDKVERYLLEDVVLFCDVMIPIDTDRFTPVQMTWYKQEKHEVQHNSFRISQREVNRTTDTARITLESQRAYISGAASQTQLAGERLYSVTETLHMRRIKQTDFGYYLCRASFTQILKGKDRPVPSSWTTCMIQLMQVVPRKIEMYLPPLGMLHSIASFAQLQTDDDEILVERRINGQPAEELARRSVCHPGFSLLVDFLVPHFFLFRDVERLRSITIKEHLMQQFVTDKRHFCISDAMYGIHTLKISREFYNAQTQTKDFEEVDYPRSLHVAPSFPYIFGDARDSADFTFFSECWTEKGYIKSDYCLKRKEHIDRSIALHVSLDLTSFFLVLCFIPLLLYWWYKLIRFVMHALLRDVFHGPALHCQEQARRPSRAPRRDCQGQVFLSYSTADDLVAQEIRATLTDFNLNVFDCHADVPLGQPLIPAWDRAIESCATFVVVVSPDYLADNLLQQGQLRGVVYPVLEDEVCEQRLLVVRVRDCPLPASLQSFPSVCDVTQRHWQRRLEWWALLTSPPPRHLPYVIRQAYRDVGRDVTDRGRGVWRNYQRNIQGSAVTRACVRMYMHLAKLPTRRRAVLGRYTSEETVQANGEQAEPTGTARACDTEPSHKSASSEALVRVTQPANADPYDVFLTYCEDSPHDCHVSAKVKAGLEGQGLRVFDAVKDVLGGQSETEVVTSASVCPSCVVVLSPAYKRHSLMRRLHFPLVLQGLWRGSLSEDSVLVVITAGTYSRPQGDSATRTADTQGEGGDEEKGENILREEDQEERDGVNDYSCENGFPVPHALNSAHRVEWSGNLSEDDHVTQITRWATATRRLLHRARCGDLDIRRQRYLEKRGRALHRPMTLTSSGRFAL